MSGEDIPKGTHWPNEVGTRLESCDVGIICVTADNQAAPWLLFEAGALAKKLSQNARVCTLLVDLSPADLAQGPLALYQTTEATREDVWRLMQSLNELLVDSQLSDERLQRSFDRCWPELANRIAAIRSLETAPAPPRRAEHDILEEILVLVRDQSRLMASKPVGHEDPEPRTAQLLAAIEKRWRPLAEHLRASAVLDLRDGRLRILHKPGDFSVPADLQRMEGRLALDEALAEVFGRRLVWHLGEGPIPI